MSPDLTTLIAELEEAERAATPGPWSDHKPGMGACWIVDSDGDALWIAPDGDPNTISYQDARLIALMRTHLPALIEAVKQQGEALEPFARGGWGKDFYKNAPEDTPVIVKALPPESLGRSFHLTKADFDRARYVYGLFEGGQK